MGKADPACKYCPVKLFANVVNDEAGNLVNVADVKGVLLFAVDDDVSACVGGNA